jgi:hypothetical protein
MTSLVRVLVATVLLLAAVPASADPVRQAEAELRASYSDYRLALLRTNQNDPAGSLLAIDAFNQSWSRIVAGWRQAPPQFASDAMLADTLRAVAERVAKARSETAQGLLPQAHETLEEVRELVAGLRARNGVVSFSEPLNAYHHQMEVVLNEPYDGLSSAGLRRLGDDAAVLLYLAKRLLAAPALNEDKAERDRLIAPVIAASEALRRAVSLGEPEAVKQVLRTIKPPFARLFVRFG